MFQSITIFYNKSENSFIYFLGGPLIFQSFSINISYRLAQIAMHQNMPVRVFIHMEAFQSY